MAATTALFLSHFSLCVRDNQNRSWAAAEQWDGRGGGWVLEGRLGGDEEVEGVREGRKDFHTMGSPGNSDCTP